MTAAAKTQVWRAARTHFYARSGRWSARIVHVLFGMNCTGCHYSFQLQSFVFTPREKANLLSASAPRR